MSKLKLFNDRPGLLVSVRSAAEAFAALAGGADVIDVKEPSHGSLGAADGETISAVVRAVARRVPVSAALGELVDLIGSPNSGETTQIADGISLFKIGLSRCAKVTDWQALWQRAVDHLLSKSSDGKAQAVAVVYADWRAARSPSPDDILSAAVRRGCPALLIDTWDKSNGTLFDLWPLDELQAFLAAVKSHGIAVVLAGSLTGQAIVTAARLAPDLVAVRTAACDGGRSGMVSETKVRELKNAIETTTQNMAVL